MAHHDFQEFNDDFRTWPDQNLAFTSLFGIVNGFKSIAQYVHAHHLETWLETGIPGKNKRNLNLILKKNPRVETSRLPMRTIRRRQNP